MEEYIQWFVEEVLKQRYKQLKSMDIWLTEKSTKKNIFNIQCNYTLYTLERQMTIYDIM